MRFSLFITLLFVSIIGIGYWYQSTAYICPAPLAYRLGTVDAEFNLNLDEAKTVVAEAATVWETATNRSLFVYDENADFTVNFIFDERQANSNNELSERERLDAERDKNEALFLTIEQLQNDFNNLSASYKNQVNEYEARLTAYNEEVQRYNDQNGAPADVYARLADEQAALNEESARLNNTADELNQLGMRLNELGERGNAQVEAYNRAVLNYNDRHGHTNEFTQGDYRGDSINIYEFSNENELQTVLVHEFGHALSIDHIDASSSVMYYLLEDTNSPPVLTNEDLAAFTAVCGTGDEWHHQIRRSIRTVLTRF